VAAGTPILAQENIVDHLYIDSAFTRKGTLFALEVKGDSMINADIKAGDYVIVRQQPVADNGDIVVAVVEGEGTVKRLKMEGDEIELAPENPKYRPIEVENGDEFQIAGKVISVYRVPKKRH
jgi:repressor LexA